MAPPSTPDKYPTLEMYDSIVKVKVGTVANTRTFEIHKGVICFYSGFFDKALNGQFAEAQSGEVVLPEEELDVFSQVVGWFYTRRLSFENINDMMLVCKLWTFADKHDIPLLMNASVDALRDLIIKTRKSPIQCLHFIYDHSTAQCGLRRLVMIIIARTGGVKLLDEESEVSWREDALKDILRLVWESDYKRPTKEWVAQLDMCQYHQHKEGVDCKASVL